MRNKYDDVLRQNENQRAQIELLTKTIGEHTAALTKPTEVLVGFPPLREPRHEATS